MAYDKIIPIHSRLDHCIAYVLNHDKTELETVLSYIQDEGKNRVCQGDTEIVRLETAINCSLENACYDMTATKARWGKNRNGHVLGYHLVHSFAPGEVTPEQAHANGVEFAEQLLGDRYEVVISTHVDHDHLHCHILFNSVSFVDGRMYRNNFKDYFGDIRGISNEVSEKHGLSVISTSGKGKQYSEWQAEKNGKPTVRELVRRDFDMALANAFTIKSFWENLKRMGYTVKRGPNIKHTTVCPSWGKKNIRLDGLGTEYTEEGIKARLATERDGSKMPLPRTVPIPPELASWSTPGRRYHVSRGILRNHPQKLKGFRALCFKYLYLLGAIRKGRPLSRAAFVSRDEIFRFDRYQQQFLYLQKNHIETAAQLAMQYDALQATIDALSDQRRDLYRERRREGESEATTEKISEITANLRVLRRGLKLCTRIEGDIPRVQAAIVTHPQDRSKTHEKTDKGRPSRNFKVGSALYASDR